jgi:multidrug efflux pump subunit AcrA (membrane-fusion protein)
VLQSEQSDMFLLADLTQMEAQVDVQERDLHRVELGKPCCIVPDAYPDRSYRGRLDRIDPQANRQRGVVEIRVLVIDPDDNLRPHMNCRIDFIDEPRHKESGRYLRIPRRSIVHEGRSSLVFVLKDDRARRRAVDTADDDGQTVGIRSGLSAGEIVLVPGERGLVEGQSVSARLP